MPGGVGFGVRDPQTVFAVLIVGEQRVLLLGALSTFTALGAMIVRNAGLNS